jgi:outer membrane protein assembly factor BamB
MAQHSMSRCGKGLALGAWLIVSIPAWGGEKHWPSFRGPRASGVHETAKLPATWNVKTGENIKWKTEIPGLAHSSPIVWGDRVFVTTAVSEQAEPILRVGLYGESPEHEEEIAHEFRVYAVDLGTGNIVWEKTAHRGVPKVKRHIKSTHANSTPATDGKYVVASFGSEGLYAFDFNGKQLWARDLGLLDSGAFNVPSLQWGFGSSPIIHDGRVIVQCDVNNQSFVAAFDVATGEPIWRKDRDEQPGWGTPTIHVQDGRTQIIVNGYKHIGAYDFTTGEEVWRMHGGGDIPVPTPVVADELVYITNAHGGQSPVYAIRTSAKGVVGSESAVEPGEFIAWTHDRRGSYMQTPLVYRGLLYACKDNGVLNVFDAKSGDIRIRERLGDGSTGFSASPVAGDGKVFYTSEMGDILVLKSGPSFEQIAINEMGEVSMATPAIAADKLIVRTRRHLVAIGD